MTAKVSVVIPTYNYGRFIGEAIESVLAQTFPIAEIVVIDSASTDETTSVLRAFAGRVRHVVQKNLGVCAARNRGVKETTGEYIALLDADDRWLPQKIEKQMAKFAADNEIGLVHCGMRKFDTSTGETLCVYLDGAEGWIADHMLLWEPPFVIGPGGTIVLTRRAFDEAGGFDTRLRLGEDLDFCYRVARLYKVAFVAEPLVDYRDHGANAHMNVREMERGVSLMYEKAFDTDDPALLLLKNQAYGNFYRTLAGSYLYAGEYTEAIRTGVLSLRYRPSNIGYFAGFPLRRLKGGHEG